MSGGWYHVASRGNRHEAIYVAMRYGRQRLVKIVRSLSILKYGAATQAVRRFEADPWKDAAKVRFVESLRQKLGELRPHPFQ